MKKLTNIEKRFIAFALYSLAMRMGNDTFEQIIMIAKKLDVIDDLIFYAHDWLEFSKKAKKE